MRLLKVKPFQETLHKGYCGPAVLKMVLKYYGIEKSEKELATVARTTKIGGTGIEDIIRVFNKFSLKTKLKNNASFSDIKRFLNKEVPVIVDWYTRGRTDYHKSAIAEGHYSVVVGLSSTYIYLQDPEIGKLRKMKRIDFERVWFDYSGEFPKLKTQFIIRQFLAIFR